MTLTVVNGYKDGWIGDNKIYIGRVNNKLKLQQSLLANPYVIGKDGDRDQVVAKYRAWLWQQVVNKTNVYGELVRLSKLHQQDKEFQLCCYCKPQSCHGDVIILAVKYIIKETTNVITTRTES